MLFLGITCYKKWWIRSSWRNVYIGTTLIGVFFSLLQIALIFRINRIIGISDYALALGDDVLNEFVGGVQFLPLTIMMVNLCPQGSEGAS